MTNQPPGPKNKFDILHAISDSCAVPVDENSGISRIIDGVVAGSNDFPYAVIKRFDYDMIINNAETH